MKTALKIYLLCSLVLCFSQAWSVTPAGSTQGSFSVNNAGAATYDLTIQAPPGIAGLKPQFSLHYDSQAGRGVAGLGWSLEGLPAIRRCPQTIAQDGTRKGVSLTATDRFCYNNQRLVLTAAGTYGADQSTYRTEVDSLARFTAQGSVGTGPASFLMEEASGAKTKFGSSTDARLKTAAAASGDTAPSSVLTWFVSEAVDPAGNKISYTYKTGGSGELLLDTVSYAGGKAKLVFNYRSDPNPRTLFVAGGKIQYTQLLDRVSTYVNQTVQGQAVDVLVKDYRLGYEFADAKGATEAVKPIGRLTSVTECSTAKEATAQNCLTPTRFEWDAWREADNSFGVPKRVGSPTDSKLNFSADNEYSTEGAYFIRRVFDLNRDGRLDFISTWRDGMYGYLSNSDGGYSSNPSKLISDFGENQGWLEYKWGSGALHFSSNSDDGSPILFGFSNSLFDVPGGVYSSAWNQTSMKFNEKRKLLSQTDIAGNFLAVCDLGNPPKVAEDGYIPKFLVDINGDGYQDIVRMGPGGVIAAKWLADNSTIGPPQSIGASAAQDCTQQDGGAKISWDPRVRPTFMQDMNNDGSADLVTAQPGGVFVSLYDPVSGFFGSLTQYSVGIAGSAYLFRTGGRPADETFLVDMNSDGYPDIVQMKWDGIYVSLWTGIKFLPSTKWSSHLSGAGWNPSDSSKGDTMAHFVVDVDGDGFPDVVGISGDQAVRVMLSDGATSFASPQPWSSDFKWDGPDRSGNYYYQYNKTPRFMADVDGDGTPDIVGFGTKFMSWAPGSRLPGARIKRVTDGLGVSVDVRYGVAQPYNKEVYKIPATPSIVPQRDAPGPIYVVSSTLTSNGLGGQRETTYKYGERRIHLHRGNLGFAWMEQLDKATNILTRREFYQEHPKIGLLKKQTTSLNGRTLSLIDSPWQQASLGKAGESASNDRYFVFPGTRTEESFDLTGTALPTKTTTVSYLGADGQFPTPFWGHLTQRTVSFSDGHNETTSFTYHAADATNWLFNRVKTSKVENTRPAPNIALTDPGDGAAKEPPSAAVMVLSAVDFGERSLGSETLLDAVLMNSGTVAGSLTKPSAASVTGDDFSFASTDCGISLGVNASCKVSIKFKPTVVGNRYGTLSIALSTGSLQATLKGGGKAASTDAPVVLDHVNPGATGTVIPAYSGSTLAVYYRNNGNAPVTLNSANATSASVFYNADGSGSSCVPGVALAAGARCWLLVNHSVATGTQSTTLTANFAGVPAIQTALSFTQTTLEMSVLGNGANTAGTADMTVTLSNRTGGGFKFGLPRWSLSPSGAGSWGVQTDNCPTVLTNGSSCTVVVRYKAAGAGAANLTLSPYGTFEWNDLLDGRVVAGSGMYRAGPVNVASLGLSATGQVDVAPSITGAFFSPAQVTSGGKSQLCWNAANVVNTKVSCTSQYAYAYDGSATGAVCGPSDTVTVGTGSGTCTITGTNAAGTTSVSTLSINVVAPPTIQTASFSSANVTSGNSNTLNWTLGGGAVSASVSCSGIASGSGSSSPLTIRTTGAGTGTCTVTASNAAGASVARSVNFTSVLPPSITGAFFSPAQVTSGGKSQLCWNAANVVNTKVSCTSQYAYAYDGSATGAVCGPSDRVTVGIGTGTCTITGTNAAGTTSVLTPTISVVPR